MSVSKYATQAGKKYETDLMKLMRDQGYDVERLRLTGAEDEGDLLVRYDHRRYVIEAKRRKTLDLAGWVKEAEIERDNYVAHRNILPYAAAFSPVGFVVVHHARGKNISQSYVTTTLDEWLNRL